MNVKRIFEKKYHNFNNKLYYLENVDKYKMLQ